MTILAFFAGAAAFWVFNRYAKARVVAWVENQIAKLGP